MIYYYHIGEQYDCSIKIENMQTLPANTTSISEKYNEPQSTRFSHVSPNIREHACSQHNTMQFRHTMNSIDTFTFLRIPYS